MTTNYTVKRTKVTNVGATSYFFTNANTWVGTNFPWDSPDFAPKTFTDLNAVQEAVDALACGYEGWTFEIIANALSVTETVYATTFHADVAAMCGHNALAVAK
jgi:hypothetical protein